MNIHGNTFYTAADDSILLESKEFAENIMDLCLDFTLKSVPQRLVDNLLESATQIKKTVYKSQSAINKKDYISFINSSVKYCKECEYWLELIISAIGGYAAEKSINNLIRKR